MLRDSRLQLLRDQFQKAGVDAYLVTSYDEHREELKDWSESPLMFITGFSFRSGEAAVAKA